MRKLLGLMIVFSMTFFFGNQVKAQDHEAGIVLGAAEYLGDLTYTHVTWSESKFHAGGLYRYYFNPRLNFKGGIFYGSISGADANKEDYANEGAAFSRGLSFESHLLEFTAQLEYNILPFISGNKIRNWSPYVFAGVSAFNFNPKTEFNGETVELQPIGTEGQGRQGYDPKYNLTQFSVPYGIGFKYSFKRPVSSGALNLYLWNIGIFVQQNKTFTDHLDDVGGYYPDFNDLDLQASQLSDRQGQVVNGAFVPTRTPGNPRGNPDADDSYMWLGFTITKTFRKNTCFCF